ncbi:MAG: cytochrome c oxidase assembly protein [Candidatus Paracaedibacteraceae bacterium]|nr:cytochrome c oxidase assembly protein [Candidatus Paracaedibacteraceae bacterium]
MKDHKNTHLFYLLTALSFGMLGASFAAVPLYRLICQKTGFGGTPQVGLFNIAAPAQDQYVRVKFTATTNRDLPWHFVPKQSEVTIKIGEPKLVYYEATNQSYKPIIGMATYNVSPDKAGIFFGKIQCFCFEQQLLKPGETVDMPVLFTISPDILKDPFTKNLKTLTLSYTFFEYKH